MIIPHSDTWVVSMKKCMQKWSGLRSAAVLHGVYPHQYRGKGDTCAQGASKVACSEAAHDSPVMNHIHNRTVVCRLAAGHF